MDEASISIAAPPERVWDLVSDITRMGDGGTLLTQWRDRDTLPLPPVRWLASALFQGKIEEEMVDGMSRTLTAIKTAAEQPGG